MPADMPDIPTPASPVILGGNHSCRWIFTINVGFLVANLVICYLIRVWWQEMSCQYKLKALEEEHRRSR